MKVEDLRHQYPNEWILVTVEKEDTLGLPTEGQLIAHSPDAEALWDEVVGRQGQFSLLYTGAILKDMAVIF